MEPAYYLYLKFLCQLFALSLTFVNHDADFACRVEDDNGDNDDARPE
eukprot:CAMPEP_0197242058 /NCGR_PEP_ID=MMETSP1429-20130617/7915_1 /TAXON_ID=49237 /ORGANISM="Chaetoceros  sp., Strain UNC1202" /LENGTH=46 /DNA_ID= /DNA_START= /DNA_END= /DNA_ORIENTATION=